MGGVGVTSCRLHLLTCCRLSRQKESLGILAVSAELEGAEILIPITMGNLRLRLNPLSQPVQVIQTDASIVHSLDEMLSDSTGHLRPVRDAGHLLTKRSLTKNETPEFIT
jgi:hypothetical protein